MSRELPWFSIISIKPASLQLFFSQADMDFPQNVPILEYCSEMHQAHNYQSHQINHGQSPRLWNFTKIKIWVQNELWAVIQSFSLSHFLSAIHKHPLQIHQMRSGTLLLLMKSRLFITPSSVFLVGKYLIIFCVWRTFLKQPLSYHAYLFRYYHPRPHGTLIDTSKGKLWMH
jgi:hypothetical protein